MSYLDESLTTGEIVHYRTGLHWTVLFWPLVLAIVFVAAAAGLFVASSRAGEAGGPAAALGIAGVVCILIGVLAVAIGVVRRSSIEMAVTDRRVLMKSGILGRKTVELMLSKVESVGVEQNFAGRLAGYGKVVVRGTGGTYEVFDRIARPLEFRRQVQERIQLSPATEGVAGRG